METLRLMLTLKERENLRHSWKLNEILKRLLRESGS